PPAPSATNPNEHSPSWASPTTQTLTELDQALLVGRVDPAREGQTLVVRQISLADAKHVPAAAKALWEAAEWVGCTDVRAERVLPETLAAPLAAALASA
ncbi:hypothetical protein ACWCW0_36450, partial [Streptomyces sp. NPDC001758]